MDLLHLISWLETQPSDGTYPIGPAGCALEQWAHAVGVSKERSYQVALELGHGPLGEVAGVWDVDVTRTFGAMLERARAKLLDGLIVVVRQPTARH